MALDIARPFTAFKIRLAESLDLGPGANRNFGRLSQDFFSILPRIIRAYHKFVGQIIIRDWRVCAIRDSPSRDVSRPKPFLDGSVGYACVGYWSTLYSRTSTESAGKKRVLLSNGQGDPDRFNPKKQKEATNQQDVGW